MIVKITISIVSLSIILSLVSCISRAPQVLNRIDQEAADASFGTWDLCLNAQKKTGMPPIVQSDPFEPTSSYTKCDIEGFHVYISAEAFGDTDLLKRGYDLLRTKFSAINQKIPSKHVEFFKKIKFWIELSRTSGAADYHPSEKWLLEHKINPDKAKSIELSNLKHLLEWSDEQPEMLLHELAHAYHFIKLGEDYQPLIKRFNDVQASDLYQQVKHVNGSMKRAYALNNKFEFFAELSEAYWGKNDFYPFQRDDLKAYDKVSYDLLGSIWDPACLIGI
ncbi:MAG: hypothetical protein HQK54_14995 [Oligoflexales bacterium]|nr:hypothetical protein [Oligoflexales bacterium]